MNSPLYSITNARTNLGYETVEVKPYCCSAHNNFIPIFALRNGTYISNGAKQELMYNPYMILGGTYFDRKPTMLMKYIDNGSIRASIINGREYFTGKLLLFEHDEDFNGRILFSGIISREYFRKFLKISTSVRNTYEAYQQFDENEVTFIVNSIIETPAYRGIKKRIMNYLDKYFSNNDVVFTNNMSKWGFNGVINTPKFTSVLERVEYINTVKKSLL